MPVRRSKSAWQTIDSGLYLGYLQQITIVNLERVKPHHANDRMYDRQRHA